MSFKKVSPVKNLLEIKESISKVAKEANREPDDIALMVVSKNQSVKDILPLLESGHRLFGENKVQEALDKWPVLREQYPDICLHLIGPLQTNKSREAVALFDNIETIDRPKLVHSLAKEMDKQQRYLPYFIQVNIGNEPQKSGCAIEDISYLISLCKDLNMTQIEGLMCIPPLDQDPVIYFKTLKSLTIQYGLRLCSMGMTNDYREAIQSGTTIIRIGSAIFGPRT
jgi:pyridoxal phosphate enzyme (YggS family)